MAECTTRYQIVRLSEIRIGVDLDWYVEVATKGVAMSIAKCHRGENIINDERHLLAIFAVRAVSTGKTCGYAWAWRVLDASVDVS